MGPRSQSAQDRYLVMPTVFVKPRLSNYNTINPSTILSPILVTATWNMSSTLKNPFTASFCPAVSLLKLSSSYSLS